MDSDFKIGYAICLAVMYGWLLYIYFKNRKKKKEK